jgi:SAM-dependent MidA family methyltransferase
MSSLPERLRARIQSEGPITFRDFMATALYDEAAGYYCREHQRWGREGDYRTSPERSVLFAATFANYFARLFRELGSPANWVVFEAGAGSGKFAEGVLDTLRLRAPEVFKATRYLIDEQSPSSRANAAARLARFGGQVGFAKISDSEKIPIGVIFANELLDAFPVHRVTTQSGVLQEFFVDLDQSGGFIWQLGEPPSAALQDHLAAMNIHLEEGQIAEVNLGISDWLTKAAGTLARGYLITVDYGAEAAELFSPGNHPYGTLRSFKRHELLADVLANPGEQDITSSVDWSAVIRVGKAVGFSKIVHERQDRFLMNEGLLEELELRVGETADEAERARLRASCRELILPGGMAGSFQVLVQEKL